MSQHDFTIANASRTTVRTDIEDALQALASNSKGATAPATPYAGQMWVEDDNPSSTVWTLKIYGGSGWAPIGTWNTSTNVFTPANTPSGVPAGAMFGYAGSAAPSGYLLCYGQAVSRTTYADLFAAISTTYGAGDGSTTFNLPDRRGRIDVGKDNMGGSAANRVTNGASGITGITLGATGGAETVTLAANNVPDIGDFATGADPLGAGADLVDAVAGGGGGTISKTPTLQLGQAGQTSPAAVNKMPPSIVVNVIIKT